MTLNEFCSGLENLGFPVAYRKYEEGEVPPLPYLVYYMPGSNNFSADGKVYLKINEINIELYSTSKDIDSETKIEKWLDENNIFYEKTEVFIKSENMLQVTYEMEV